MRRGDPRTITPDAADYPRRLRARHVLHVRGTVAEPTLAVAIVGARAASRAAIGAAETLARGVVAVDGTVISGGAIGVDAAAHRGALAGAGRTIAVLGCGVDVVYPARHAGLFDQIVDGGGALVSTFADGLTPQRGFFVARNRVIAALSDVVVVVEASASSGALYTARAAIELGRAVGAVGDSPGVRALFAAGASPIETAADVVELAAGRGRRTAPPPVDARAEQVARAIGAGATADELVERTGLSPRSVACALMDLEAAGWVQARPGGPYVTTAIAPC